MTILLLDNYDSFTYNLLHYLAELGAETEVVRNDALSVTDIRSKQPQGILISPGPGRPEDAGICPDVIRELGAEIPIFGVCLGHQAIGMVFGGDVIRAPQPMHGKTSLIHHMNEGVFSGLPSPFTATRYHSLIVKAETLPDTLKVTAQTEDGLIMGLQHRHYPIHGVQFHPESIASEHGHALLNNFLTLTLR
ncbi:MAG: aminodeoxychorismate/anthranilate synthase component II [Rickettsiales bacterium]|nr:aminodeoxychorismate/anthranilate synthase component II [Rickettsiales bacterium]